VAQSQLFRSPAGLNFTFYFLAVCWGSTKIPVAHRHGAYDSDRRGYSRRGTNLGGACGSSSVWCGASMLTNDTMSAWGSAMKASQFFRHMRRIATSFWCDTSGIILPYVAILLVAIVGVSLLALDGGRAYSLATPVAKRSRCRGACWGCRTHRAPGARCASKETRYTILQQPPGWHGTLRRHARHTVFYEDLPQRIRTILPERSRRMMATPVVAVKHSHTMDTVFSGEFCKFRGNK